ncbi:hypothetical protein Gpo141_00010384 [Globisporangium polare]
MLVAHMTPHPATIATPDTRKSAFQWRASFASTYAHSSGSSSTSSSSSSSCCGDDDVLDLEALALSAGSDYEDTFRSSRWRHSDHDEYYDSTKSIASPPGGGRSGLPLVCSNCGVSFFSLQITDDELECYCSGECKWSVVMYREMDRRMHALRRHVRATTTAAAVTTRAAQRPAATNSNSSTFVASTRSSATSAAENCAAHPMDDVIPCR